MERFVLVSASVNNKSLITQSVTKQKLAKHQALQISTCRIDSLQKEINRIYLPEQTLSDKDLSRPHIKLSDLQTLVMDGVKTGVLLSKFPNQRQKFRTINLLYFKVLVCLRHCFWTNLPKAKRHDADCLSKNENQKLQGFYKQNGTAYGSVQNLVKASKLPVSKVIQFCLQNIPIQKLLSPRVTWKEWKHLLDSEMKFEEWILHKLIN